MLRRLLRRPIGRGLLFVAEHPPLLRALNSAYAAAPPRWQAQLNDRLPVALEGLRPPDLGRSTWRSTFAGRSITVPLHGSDPLLRWQFGLTLTGHDYDVKALYRRLIESASPPRVFFDIGANFGTHSVLLLAHGVRTVSFEPNPRCHELLEEVCAANGLVPDIQPVAVGREEGRVRLAFPPGLTWLGTVVADIEAELASRFDIASVEVPMTTIDAYVRSGGPLPDLMKIDTEGNELAVLQGASETLAAGRPLIVFESRDESERGDLASFFDEAGYELVSLWHGTVLSRRRFVVSSDVNHLARARARGSRPRPV